MICFLCPSCAQCLWKIEKWISKVEAGHFFSSTLRTIEQSVCLSLGFHWTFGKGTFKDNFTRSSVERPWMDTHARWDVPSGLTTSSSLNKYEVPTMQARSRSSRRCVPPDSPNAMKWFCWGCHPQLDRFSIFHFSSFHFPRISRRKKAVLIDTLVERRNVTHAYYCSLYGESGVPSVTLVKEFPLAQNK